MQTITLTTEKYTKKQGTKNVYNLNSVDVLNIDSKQYSSCTSKDTIAFFRRLGGLESVTRSHTCNGYCITKIISTSPDKLSKTVRKFSFKWVD